MKLGWNENDYTAGGVTAKIKIGQTDTDPCIVKLFDDHSSFTLYEGFDEEQARMAWSFISRLLSGD